MKLMEMFSISCNEAVNNNNNKGSCGYVNARKQKG